MANTNEDSVLYIEDDPLISDLVGQKFLTEKIIVQHAGSGEEALTKLKAAPKPKLILLDIRLPGMDGFSVLEKLKADEATKDIPVIIFSNFGEDADKERAKKLGAKDYVVKVSRSLNEMAELVRSYLKGSA